MLVGVSAIAMRTSIADKLVREANGEDMAIWLRLEPLQIRQMFVFPQASKQANIFVQGETASNVRGTPGEGEEGLGLQN